MAAGATSRNAPLTTQSQVRAALGAALFIAGLALGGCGSQSASSTASTSATTSTALTTAPTVTTATHTVVGTTPAGLTVTQTTTHVTTAPAGPDGVALEPGPPLGSTSTTIQGQTIDGIQCNRINQLAYQAYAHLQVYVHGQPRALPGAIGMVSPNAGTSGTTTTYRQGLCAYWLVTRAANGVIAVHSPVPGTYTLGELFDIWGEPLTRSLVAGIRGHVTAIVNGRSVPGDPRAIPLREHESIELAVGRPVPRFHAIDWSVTNL